MTCPLDTDFKKEDLVSAAENPWFARTAEAAFDTMQESLVSCASHPPLSPLQLLCQACPRKGWEKGTAAEKSACWQLGSVRD